MYLNKSTSVLSVCSHKNKSNVQRSHRTVILLLLFYYIYMLLYTLLYIIIHNYILLYISWETCMQVRKQQLELDMEKQTGSK